MRISFLLVLCAFHCSYAQGLPEIPLSKSWVNNIVAKAEIIARPISTPKKRVLLFSLFTGFEHWTIPHTSAVLTAAAQKTGQYEIIESTDIDMFDAQILDSFDVVILNNTCSKREHRDIFLDVLEQRILLTPEQVRQKALTLEDNLLSFVKNGKGLVVLHGGITMLNKSQAFSTLVGGSFDYHPPQQEIAVSLVEENHPILSPFKGKGFTHIDEPYFFKGAYDKKDFRPLLSMKASQITKKKSANIPDIQYISWIKSYGKGRVFYASMSHNPQSYEQPGLVAFLVKGIDYAREHLFVMIDHWWIDQSSSTGMAKSSASVNSVPSFGPLERRALISSAVSLSGSLAKALLTYCTMAAISASVRLYCRVSRASPD